VGYTQGMTGSHRAGLRLRAIFVIAAVVAAWTSASAQTVNPNAAALDEFRKRVETYVELHKRAASGLPAPKKTRTPDEIEARERQLAESIRAVRTNARAGDLFGPAAPILRQIVRRDWARRSPADRRALRAELQEDGPYVGPVSVNMSYPSGVSLATAPAGLLQELPRLPEVLEYRLLAGRLILRDVSANLIVDLVEKAVPAR
jgi:hypothetical protein